jgi:hypothetical protein
VCRIHSLAAAVTHICILFWQLFLFLLAGAVLTMIMLSPSLATAAAAALQVQKIRLLLRQRGLGAVRVGTVDDYQVGRHCGQVAAAAAAARHLHGM